MNARQTSDTSRPAPCRVDLGHSVHDLCAQCPELKDILYELGFTDIVKPGMLHTAGRFMTLPNGARMKGIPLDQVRARLEQAGIEVVG